MISLHEHCVDSQFDTTVVLSVMVINVVILQWVQWFYPFIAVISSSVNPYNSYTSASICLSVASICRW